MSKITIGITGLYKILVGLRDLASLSGSLGDKGLFRSANILNVVRLHAVRAMFLDNISP